MYPKICNYNKMDWSEPEVILKVAELHRLPCDFGKT